MLPHRGVFHYPRKLSRVRQGGIVFSKNSIEWEASCEAFKLQSQAATSSVFAKRPRRDVMVNVLTGTVPFRTALRNACADTYPSVNQRSRPCINGPCCSSRYFGTVGTSSPIEFAMASSETEMNAMCRKVTADHSKMLVWWSAVKA